MRIPGAPALARCSIAGSKLGTASSDTMSVNSRCVVAAVKVGCVPSVDWISSRASRTGSTKRLAARRQLHVAADTHQQGIAEKVAQPVQCRAHRGL